MATYLNLTVTLSRAEVLKKLYAAITEHEARITKEYYQRQTERAAALKKAQRLATTFSKRPTDANGSKLYESLYAVRCSRTARSVKRDLADTIKHYTQDYREAIKLIEMSVDEKFRVRTNSNLGRLLGL